MSQWSEEKSIRGCRFVAHVAGPAFASAQPNDIIDDVLLVHETGGLTWAKAKCEALHRRFVGQPYSAWLNFDPAQPNA